MKLQPPETTTDRDLSTAERLIYKAARLSNTFALVMSLAWEVKRITSEVLSPEKDDIDDIWGKDD